jgi:hypothetical protein
MTIRYRQGYKYQLHSAYWCTVQIIPFEDIYCGDNNWVELYRTGELRIQAGYAWDGPSGPTIDTKTFMRGSLIHDALYQLIREGELPKSARVQADRELYRACREDGMNLVRAAYVYAAVRLFGRWAVQTEKEILEAP